MFTVLMYASFAALSSSLEVIISKILAKRGLNGMHTGFCFLLVSGAAGLLFFAGCAIVGDTEDITMSWASIGTTAGAATTAFAAVSLLQMSVSMGPAGLALSLF